MFTCRGHVHDEIKITLNTVTVILILTLIELNCQRRENEDAKAIFPLSEELFLQNSTLSIQFKLNDTCDLEHLINAIYYLLYLLINYSNTI